MIWFEIAALICGEDLFFKSYVRDQIGDHEERTYLKDKVVLTKYFNKGAMLGWMKDSKERLKIINLIGIGGIAGALAAYSGKNGYFLQKLGLAMMLGGACSNVYDRYRHGAVTDYIRFNVGPKRFRQIIFNHGDFALFIGTALLATGEFIIRR